MATLDKLKQRLASRKGELTTSEQKIATYLLYNISGIPFETATSLGRHVGVSSMTVGRFLRSLGYAGVGELKDELRADPSWMDLYKMPTLEPDSDVVVQSLQADIRALTELHALTRTAQWQAAVETLAGADRVSVASFQHGRFLGLGFSSLLRHVRPHVYFADGADGAYTDLLLDSSADSCVVLIDITRYSRHFRVLAEEVVKRGIPLVIITDKRCYWARQMTDMVLAIAYRPDDRVWHSFADLTSLFSLLVGALAREQSDVYQRIGDITELRDKFIGYTGSASRDD